MRRGVYLATVSCLLVGGMFTSARAEGFSWPRLWPIGDSAETTTADDDAEAPIRVWLPSIEIRPLWGESAGQMGWTTPIEAGWDSLRQGADRVKQGAMQLHQGSNKVWHSTRQAFTRPLFQVKSGPPQPSMWQRMFGPPQDEGARTMREFFSQKRLR